MAIEVHKEFLQRRFVAKFWSLACLINLLIIAGATILPLYIAWASHSFWIKETVRYEQPTIEYKNSLMIVAHGMKGTTNPVPITLAWTTSPAANAMLQTSTVLIRHPVVKSSSTDNNFDAKAEAIQISAKFPLEADEVILGASAAAWVDVELSSVTRATFDGLLYATVGGSGVRGSGARIDGTVAFHQHDAIPSPPSGVFSPYLLSPLTMPESAINSEQLALSALMEQYLSRNITVALDPMASVWIPENGYTPKEPNSAEDLSGLAMNPRSFDLSLKVRVSPTGIRVRPGVAEELKHGWIQYFSFLAVTAVAGWLLRSFIFGYKIIETNVFVDAPRSKLHVE